MPRKSGPPTLKTPEPYYSAPRGQDSRRRGDASLGSNCPWNILLSAKTIKMSGMEYLAAKDDALLYKLCNNICLQVNSLSQ
jgi:hypothetical protein